MILLGILIGALLAGLFVAIAGPYGAAIFLVVVFGYVFATYSRVKQTQEDVRLIREKLGLLREHEIIESEIKQKHEVENGRSEGATLEALNRTIERELDETAKDRREK